MFRGAVILPLFLFALSWGFLFKKKFFVRRKQVKIFVLTALFVVCLCSQYRFGAVHLISAIIQFLAVILLVSLGYFTLQPRFKSYGEESVLRLSAAHFSERDVCVLQQVLRGEKYEAIAASHGIAMSTLKNNLMALYKKAGVSDRTGFLLAYANYSIIRV